MFVDSHCHLEGSRFDADREQVISRARDAGISTLLAVGTGDGPGTLDCAVKLADQYEAVYATIGIHPHEAKLAKASDFDQLMQLSGHRKVVAWGEIGLDYYYDHSPRDIQKDVFVRQMELARAAKLPIVIHCRPSDNSENAWEDCLALIEQNWKPTGLGGVLHCFTGTWAHARRALDIGFMISFAGNITFPKAPQIRDSAAQVPFDRMLIETDSPFLAPVPYRGKRNEPAFVKEVARQIGEIRGLTAEQVGAQTSRNFFGFFSVPEPKVIPVR
jgi:TatD DNase family protein